MPYLDQASTSFPKPSEVSQAVIEYLSYYGVSPGRGNYRLGEIVQRKVEETRKLLANFLGVSSPEKIAFTQNATHSLNLILKGFLREGDHVIICEYSHNATLRPLHSLQRQKNIEFDILPVGLQGQVEITDFEKLVKPNTKLFVGTEASNVLGVKADFKEIYKKCKTLQIAILIDTTQSLGYIHERPPVDFIVGTGHKTLMGPSGVGFFYAEDPALIPPLFEGGNPGNSSLSSFHPESLPYKFEAGTLNCTGILGLLGALQYIAKTGFNKIYQMSMDLIDRLIYRLSRLEGVILYGTLDMRRKIPVVSFNLKNWTPQEVAYELNRRFDIAVRAGLHCAPLIHNKLNTAPQGTVRISVGHFNTSLDIDFFVEALQTLLKERNPLMVVTDYYNQNAMEYIDRTKDFDVSNIFYPFVAILPPGAKVLDLGCGSGRDSLAFLRLGFEVLAIDGSEEMVKYVHSLGVPVRQMFFEEIDFDNEFDAIWCCASLLHVQKEALPDVLLRIEKALKPGGCGFVSFKKGKGEGFESGRYFHYVDEPELRQYLSRFEILSLNSIPSDQNLTPTVWINAVIRKK